MPITTIELDEEVVCEVHELLSGRGSRLREVLAASQRALAAGKVEWSVPVTPRTVHRIVTLFLFATDNGIAVKLRSPVGLDATETIFHEDFLARGRGRGQALGERLLALTTENGRLFKDLMWVLTNLQALGRQADRALVADAGFRNALLIGQYGGEHVGDAAILGGVLLGLHRDYGTAKAHLLSHRPAHTARLADGLETPVAVTVHSSGNRQIRRLLGQVDALVFAGGPIMDLPRVLVKQLAVAGAARSRGLPIIIDRVGIGPFKRRASRWVARRIVRLASKLTVRTAASAEDPVVAGRELTIGRDPAFDYLASRTRLTRMGRDEVSDIDAVLAETDERFRIGINLRHIRHLWSPKGEAYSARVAEQFLDRLAEGLIRFAELSPVPPVYVFFAMNPQEFGMSDLRIAYELHCKLGEAVNFRVWEADPTVDGIIHLLRKVDAAVCMRFHACIFSLAQNIPTLGLDYYPGQGGKVEQLFNDLGLPDDTCRMDSLNADWLVNALMRSTETMANRVSNRGAVTDQGETTVE